MQEIILTKDELISKFKQKEIIDSGNGWLLQDNTEVEIIALHEIDPKYIKDISNAKLYKILVKGKK